MQGAKAPVRDVTALNTDSCIPVLALMLIFTPYCPAPFHPARKLWNLQENIAQNINSFNLLQRTVYSHYAEQMLCVNSKYIMFNIFDIFGLFDT